MPSANASRTIIFMPAEDLRAAERRSREVECGDLCGSMAFAHHARAPLTHPDAVAAAATVDAQRAAVQRRPQQQRAAHDAWAERLAKGSRPDLERTVAAEDEG